MGSPRWQKVLRRRPWLLCSTCVALAVSGKAFTAQSLRKEGMASHPTGPTGFAGRRDLEVSVLAEAEGTESGASVDVAVATPERSRAVQVWSVLGVAAYLSYGVKKVVPIVHQGLASITAPWQWLLLVATLGFFGFVEGYRGFQQGFCPRVVSRAWAVSEKFPEVSTRDLLKRNVARLMGKDVPEAPRATATLLHKLFAPAFCIGYFHGTRKRVISSWCVTTTIFFVVVFVRKLPNPYRAILDAGVIVGLLWGTVSVLLLFARSLRAGKPPNFDPCLPADTPYHP